MPQGAQAAVRAIVLTLYYAGQLAGFAFIARRHADTMFEAFGLSSAETTASSEVAEKPSALGSAGWVIVLFLGTEVVSIGYGLAMQAIGWQQPARLSSDISTVFGSGGVGLILSALLVAVAAPIVEELAFRGVVLSAFDDYLGMWGAIGISAALYAGFHFSLWMFFPTAVLGLALGWLAHTRRSLVPAIALHMLYNAAAVVAAFVAAR
jgi:membrane protease YdiL (CAAX protease family)